LQKIHSYSLSLFSFFIAKNRDDQHLDLKKFSKDFHLADTTPVEEKKVAPSTTITPSPAAAPLKTNSPPPPTPPAVTPSQPPPQVILILTFKAMFRFNMLSILL